MGKAWALAPDGRGHELYLSGTRDRVRTFAADGRYELFKNTTKYDGKVGREQHTSPQ
jgi:hypothetical protein